MIDVRQETRNLVKDAKALHMKERAITLESVLVIGQLDRWNAAVNLGLTSEGLARAIGLTPSVMWKRAQAARVLHHFPESLAMVKAGETDVTHLALLAPKITEANSTLLLEGIKNKSKREVEGLVSRVTADGRLLEQEEEFEFRLKLTKTQVEALDRAREVLSARGHVPSLAEIFAKALGDLLYKRDPMQQAERVEARRRASPGKAKDGKAASGQDVSPQTVTETSPRVGEGSTPPSPAKRASRSSMPAAEKHALILRDGGQCTERLAGGVRCPERAMLEIDHKHLWCRGGGDTAANTELKCRSHNQARARRELGPNYLVTWGESRGVADHRSDTPHAPPRP